MLDEVRAAAQAAALPASAAPSIFARDIDERLLAHARDNAARAGVTIAFERADARALHKEHARAVVVTNPPYGERLERSAGFERELAQAFQRLHGYRVAVLAGDRSLLRAMAHKPCIEHALWNGPLECRLLAWDIT